MSTSNELPAPFLLPDEPAPFTIVNPEGACALVLICDHACNRVPVRLNNLGLNNAALNEHIAWDPGAANVAMALSAQLDAVLVMSNYSRLVIDCNRPLSSDQSIPQQSAGVVIPANQQVSMRQRQQRVHALFTPYHNAIESILQQRQQQPVALLSIHSFTPRLNDEQRPWQVGVSFYRNPFMARSLFDVLQQHRQITVGYNQPYAIETEFDYSVPVHGEQRGLHCAMIELRQDGVQNATAVETWANRLAQAWQAIAETVLNRVAASDN